MEKPCGSKALENAPEWEEGIELAEEGQCGAGMECGLRAGRGKEKGG